ncbi:MAG: hypothetical protein KA797_02260 [Chitinophagales bacterium]|nr:hypothetical protein [Chitinophagales bacterium]
MNQHFNSSIKKKAATIFVTLFLISCEVSNDGTFPVRIWGKWKVETMSYNKIYITEQYNSYIFEFKSSDSLLIQNSPEFAIYEETQEVSTSFLYIGGFKDSKFALLNNKWTILQRSNSTYVLEAKDTNNLFINMRIYKL